MRAAKAAAQANNAATYSAGVAAGEAAAAPMGGV
jgi:hypothetical protein